MVLLMKSMDSGLHTLPNINYPICGTLIGILHAFLFNEKWHQLGRIFHEITYYLITGDLLSLFLNNFGNSFSPRCRHLIFAIKKLREKNRENQFLLLSSQDSFHHKLLLSPEMFHSLKILWKNIKKRRILYQQKSQLLSYWGTS